MWNWLLKRLALTENASLAARVHLLTQERDQLIGQVEATRAAYLQACEENAELRALVATLDSACTRLSVQLYGQEAVDRVVAQARRSGTN